MKQDDKLGSMQSLQLRAFQILVCLNQALCYTEKGSKQASVAHTALCK